MSLPEQVVVSLDRLLVRTAVRCGFAQVAEDVSHDIIIEIYRQPGTTRFVLEHAEEIHAGRIPGMLRNRVLMKARASRTRLVSLAAGPMDPDDGEDTVARDSARLDASYTVAKIVDEIPWMGRVIDAIRNGCSTIKEIADYVQLSDRTVITRLSRVRQTFPKDLGRAPRRVARVIQNNKD